MFKDLPISTITIMVYTDMTIDLPALFGFLEPLVTEPRTILKTGRNLRKNIVANYGDILSINLRNQIRGIDMRKQTSKKKRMDFFLNQVSMEIFFDTIINIMIFKSSMKIVGCRREEQITEIVSFLWRNIFSKVIPKPHAPVRFLIETVMLNVGFKIPFLVDRLSINLFMNSEEMANRVFLSQFETTEHTNVNIKFRSTKPSDFEYPVIIVQPDDTIQHSSTNVNSFREGIERRKVSCITFIVFSSSQVIMSGRYKSDMEKCYNFFMEQLMKNRNKIEAH